MRNLTLRSVLTVTSVLSAMALAACAAEEPGDELSSVGSDDLPEYGESTSDELVSENQLNGRGLPSKTIVLTYDDGPGPRTGELAEYLAEEGISATFFINGMQTPRRQEQVRAVVENGHLLANHTQNHKQLTSLSPDTIQSEVGQTDRIMTQWQPDAPSLLRAPFGAWNRKVSTAINASSPLQKYVGSIFWDVGGSTTATSAADWECWGRARNFSVEQCAELYLTEIRTRGRGIVLMHDLHNKTVEMTKVLVPKLKAEGFKFVNLDKVPAIAALIASGPADPEAKDCHSGSLGKTVVEGACVQNAVNSRWFVCTDGDWERIASPSSRCVESYPANGN